MHRPLILAALLAASALGAQEPEAAPASVLADPSVVTIDAGMTRADVVSRLGAPAAERKSGAFTYLFFANGCVRSCGMDDLVILENGLVSDAILRGAGRHYSGRSSSPAGVTPAATLGARAGRTVEEPTAYDAPAPSMVRPPARRPALAVAEPAAADAGASDTAPSPEERVVPAPSAAPDAPAAVPAGAPASGTRPAAPPARRTPADVFRIVPVVPDSAASKASSDSTSSRP